MGTKDKGARIYSEASWGSKSLIWRPTWPGLPLHWQRKSQAQNVGVGTKHTSPGQRGPPGPGDYLTRGRTAPFLLQGLVSVPAPMQLTAGGGKGQLGPLGSWRRVGSWRPSCRSSLSVPLLSPSHLHPHPQALLDATHSSLTFLFLCSRPSNDCPIQTPYHGDGALHAPSTVHPVTLMVQPHWLLGFLNRPPSFSTQGLGPRCSLCS